MNMKKEQVYDLLRQKEILQAQLDLVNEQIRQLDFEIRVEEQIRAMSRPEPSVNNENYD